MRLSNAEEWVNKPPLSVSFILSPLSVSFLLLLDISKLVITALTLKISKNVKFVLKVSNVVLILALTEN